MSARNGGMAATLPALRFSERDEFFYREIVEECVNEVLELYEDFAYQRSRRVDPRYWKAIKTRESVVVYRQRRGSNSSDQSDVASITASSTELRRGVSTLSGSDLTVAYNARHALSRSMTSDEVAALGPGAAMAVNAKSPLLLTSATLPGTLEDAMYGAFVNDTVSLRRRSAYEGDTADDVAVLHSFEQPTAQDPFNFLGIVWTLRSFSGLGAVSKRRDFLLLQRSGLTTTSQGEQIGFTVQHSVPHRDLPELSEIGIVRGVQSICTLYRQMGERVDVFSQVVMHPGGSSMNYFVLQDTAAAMLAVDKPLECAHRKKLLWRMRKQIHDARAGDSPSTASSSQSGSSPHSHSHSHSHSRRPTRKDSSHCGACNKSLSRLFSTGGSFCQLCQQRVCSHCSTSKKIIMDVTEKEVVQRPFNFCIGCSMSMRRFSAMEIHLDELAQRHHG